MWVRRMTAVCPKCSGKIKKYGGGELRCADCGMKVSIREVIDVGYTLCYDIIEDSTVRPLTIKGDELKIEPKS